MQPGAATCSANRSADQSFTQRRYRATDKSAFKPDVGVAGQPAKMKCVSCAVFAYEYFGYETCLFTYNPDINAQSHLR